MNTDPHTTILETYFFGYIDRGLGADDTPLFTRTFDGRPLASVVAERFHFALPEAEAAIDAARLEVAL